MTERTDEIDCLRNPFPSDTHMVGIGLGGIAEGWIPPVLIMLQTGVLKLTHALLCDGKKFCDRNRERQYFRQEGNKAQERRTIWSAVYPGLPLCSVPVFIDSENVGKFVPDGAVVLLSPDNHPTRALLSRHLETLENGLLIAGGNDAINKEGGEDGSKGWAAVYCRVQGMNITPPLMEYHSDILEAKEKMPGEMSCGELAQAGEPQLLATNMFVGQMMAHYLYRYLTQPLHRAVGSVEAYVDSASGEVVHYGIGDRFSNTVFSQGR